MFKVIIADDEVIEIEYLHKMFQKHSEEFQITGIASNGEDVLRLAEETKPDAVILDICMPGKSGLEAAEEVKKRFPDIIDTIKNCLKKKKKEDREEKIGNQNLDCVFTYIEAHYKEAISLKVLADIAHFSPTYLSRMFHQETECTLCSYINKKRIENAKRLLLQSEQSIQEIAIDCGFINISHFNRVFKNLVGKSPMEYKKGSEK